jgi:RNA polymerase sigma-70 factor (ECF subfamily)
MIVSGDPDLGTGAEVVAGPAADRFEDWYRATWPALVRTMAVFCGDGERATDVAAEAFARAYATWDGPDRPRHPTAWTYAVAFNVAKRQGARRSRELATMTDAAALVTTAAERDLDLWQAVAQLSPRARQAVVLRYVADLREREIATVMDIAPGTVAATLNRARAELRTALHREAQP